MAGRSKFTAERRAVIIRALENGSSYRAAAGVAGIDESSLRDWLARGREAGESSSYREFAEQVRQAEAGVASLVAKVIVDAAKDDPKWAAWYLERRDSAFSPPATRREITGGAPIVVELKLAGGDMAPMLRPVPELPAG
ncbi:MAG: transposase [Chloroflexota bacterium]